MAGCFNTNVEEIDEKYRIILVQNLIKNEGLKLFPYRDCMNKLTIGVGRNLDNVGISRNEAIVMMNNDIDRSLESLSTLSFWNELNDLRKIILTEMCYNMGFDKLQGFKKMFAALENKNYSLAASEMMNSNWAKQVKERAANLAFLMREGSL